MRRVVVTSADGLGVTRESAAIWIRARRGASLVLERGRHRLRDKEGGRQERREGRGRGEESKAMVEVGFARVEVGRSEGRSHVFISAHSGLFFFFGINAHSGRERGLQLKKYGCAAWFCSFPSIAHVPALQYFELYKSRRSTVSTRPGHECHWSAFAFSPILFVLDF